MPLILSELTMILAEQFQIVAKEFDDAQNENIAEVRVGKMTRRRLGLERSTICRDQRGERDVRGWETGAFD